MFSQIGTKMTNSDVRNLEPTAVWNHFADLNAVPRASKKEEQVIEFVKSFGERLGLETKVDEMGNIVIRKAASRNGRPNAHRDAISPGYGSSEKR